MGDLEKDYVPRSSSRHQFVRLADLLPMTHGRAYAKINLALVVGPRRRDGKHEVVTVLQRIDLHDDIALEFTAGLRWWSSFRWLTRSCV